MNSHHAPYSCLLPLRSRIYRWSTLCLSESKLTSIDFARQSYSFSKSSFISTGLFLLGIVDEWQCNTSTGTTSTTFDGHCPRKLMSQVALLLILSDNTRWRGNCADANAVVGSDPSNTYRTAVLSTDGHRFNKVVCIMWSFAFITTFPSYWRS